MKKIAFLSAILFCFISGNILAQDTNSKIQNSNVTDSQGNQDLLQSKNFGFVPSTVFPITGSPKNLVGEGYFITFSPEMVNSNMPFYGRGHHAMAIGRDTGMRFKGEPEDFSVEKNKNGYEIKVKVKDNNDIYRIILSVTSKENASLSISSKNRSIISYQGEIVENNP